MTSRAVSLTPPMSRYSPSGSVSSRRAKSWGMVDCSPPAQMLSTTRRLSRRALSRFGTNGYCIWNDPSGSERTPMPSNENLANLLADHPFGDERDLLCTIDRIVTVGEAKTLVAHLATRLVDSGVQPGEGVAVRLPSDPDLVVAMLAIWTLGAVFVPLNDRSPQGEVQHVLDTIRPSGVLDASGLRRLTSPLHHEPDIAFVTWTSGTTGPPKAILQSHSGYLELLDRVLKPLRGDGGTRKGVRAEPTPNLVPVSVALNAGIYNVCFGLRAGAALVLMPRFATGDFAELVHRYQVRSTVLPPAAMVMLTEDPAVTDLSPLRFVRSITAPLSPLAARRFAQRFGVTVLNSYGQAEVGEVVGWTAGDAREHPEKLGAAGRPLPGVDIRVVDEHDADVPLDTVGQLLVRPPRMAAGYAGGESLSDRVDAAGTCGRAITPGSTPRDSSGSRGGPRTSSIAVGTRSSPNRSRRFCASCPASRTRRSSAGPTTAWARYRSP